MRNPSRLDVVALALALPLALLALLRVLPLAEPFPLVALEAELGWLLAPAWLLLAVAAVRRHARIAALAAGPALLHAGLLAPGVIPSVSAAGFELPHVRVATVNLLAFQLDHAPLAEELVALDADVLALEELTPEWARSLEAHGVLARYPHSIVVPQDDCFGIALLSRHPITQHEIVDLGGVPRIDATLDIHGARVRVHAVHTLPPRTAEYTERWRAQMRELARVAAHADGPTILTGDLNASPVSRSYRTLTSHRLRGAHESVGRGLATTWPNGLMSVPPMRLDHVLVSPEIVVLSVAEGRGAGSDHRPVVVDLTIRSAS